MPHTPSESAGAQRLRDAWPAILLVALLWLVRYARSGEFGLYEDDLTHIPTAAQMTGPDLVHFAVDAIREFRGQGVPIKLTLWYSLANLGWRMGGLRGLYLLGFAIIGSNVILFYFIAKGLRDRAFAVCAGLAYVLYSADTTQAFLSHSFILQTSIAMLLLALTCYRRGWEAPAYLLMSLALLTYETTYMVFLAAPLLTRRWDKQWKSRLFRHILVCLGILAAVIVLRAGLGESRVSGLTLRDIALVPPTHMIVGPAVALATYGYRPVQALLSQRPDVLVVSLVGAVILVGILWKLVTSVASPPRKDIDSGAKAVGGATEHRWIRRIPVNLRSDLRLCLVGIVMLVLAYPLTFTVRAYAISGRDTRVHAAGVVGASVTVGSAMVMIIGWAEARSRRIWAVTALGAALGLTAGYGFIIQNDYARAWTLQKEFWSQLVQLIPDVGDGSVVLVDPSGLEDTRQIGANYWNLPRVLGQLFLFPSSWGSQPRAFRLVEGWEHKIWTDDDKVRLDADTVLAPPSTYRVVDPQSVILVHLRNGLPERVVGDFPGDHGNHQLQPAPRNGEPPFAHSFLYDLMVAPRLELSLSSGTTSLPIHPSAAMEAIR